MLVHVGGSSCTRYIILLTAYYITHSWFGLVHWIGELANTVVVQIYKLTFLMKRLLLGWGRPGDGTSVQNLVFIMILHLLFLDPAILWFETLGLFSFVVDGNVFKAVVLEVSIVIIVLGYHPLEPCLDHILGLLGLHLLLFLKSLASIFNFLINGTDFVSIMLLFLLSSSLQQVLSSLVLLEVVFWIHLFTRLHLQRNVQDLSWVLFLSISRLHHVQFQILAWHAFRGLLLEARWVGYLVLWYTLRTRRRLFV